MPLPEPGPYLLAPREEPGWLEGPWRLVQESGAPHPLGWASPVLRPQIRTLGGRCRCIANVDPGLHVQAHGTLCSGEPLTGCC